MNILLLSQFFSETRGGGEYVFKLLASTLAKNNHRVWVITNKIMEERYESEENLNIIFVKPTLSFDSAKLPRFSDNLRYTFNAIREGLKIIKKEKIDIIHSNNFAPALAGAILSSITSKPHVLTIHDVFSLCGKNYWKRWGAQSDVSKISVMVSPIFEKWIIRLRHDCIHTVSEATRDDLVKLGAKKPIHVIHNSVSSRQENISSQTNPFQFIHVGRLVFYKNLEVMIRAINIAKNIEPKIRLVIAGDGPHRKTLEELVRNSGAETNVEFRGYVSTKEKYELIAQSSALAFPSLCEGFGLVILEAFSLNKSVLVSNVRPMSDIVTNQKNGYVLNQDDEKEWAEHLLKITRNPSEASAMGRNGKELLARSYDQQSMYQKVVSMYNEVIKNHGK